MKWTTAFRPGDPQPGLHGCIATLGVFDGLHLGHRAILDRTVTWARTEDRPAVVITFSVHPDAVVHGRPPPLLLSLEHRRRELERCGLDAALVLHFDETLRRMEAEEFVDRILVRSLRARGLVLGHDTALGHDRRGDAQKLDQLGRERGFEVKVVGEIAVDGTVVSSTRIRAALERGDLEEVGRMLGRAPSVLGRVVPGDGRGRTVGFPTANLDLDAACHPGGGVYAVLVLLEGRRYEGLCNVGRRPTFHPDGPSTVEVHLLDFDGDLYGRTLEVVFLARLRAERAFPDVDALRRQIEADRVAAEDAFRRARGSSEP